MEAYLYEVEKSAVVDFATGSAELLVQPVEPIEIVRWGVIYTVKLTTTALVMTGNHRQLGGAALTPSGAGDLGTVTGAIGALTDIGDGTYIEAVHANAPTGQSNVQPFRLFPGEEAQFVSDNGPAAGNGLIWAHIRKLAFQDATLTRKQPALTAPVADVTWLQAYTKVTA